MKNVIWDFDGTLFDTYPAFVQSALAIMKQKYGILCDYNTVMKMAKVTADHCTNELAMKHNLDKIQLKEDIWNRYFEVSEAKDRPFSCVQEVCKRVSQIGCNLLVTHRDSSSACKLLSKFGLQIYFREIIGGRDGFPKKPDPGSFNYLAAKHQLEKNQILGVGDRDIDIKAAINAGITPCYFNPDGVEMDIATHNIRNINELLPMLE